MFRVFHCWCGFLLIRFISPREKLIKLFVGFETSSSTSCFALYALSLNQNIQEKLRNEVISVLAKHNGEITYDGMQEMKYLQMVIDGELCEAQLNSDGIIFYQKPYACTGRFRN